MIKLEIIKKEHPTLTSVSIPVEKIDKELQDLIDSMILTMREAKGVGLAAPQINKKMRLVVVETPPDTDDEGNEIPDSRDLYVLINPEIVNSSRKKVAGIEGCLSIPGYVGEVERSQAIRVKALDRRGRKTDLKLRGWPARIVQHEVDHLDGILYTDRLTAPENFWSEEEYEAMLEAEAEAEAAEENG